MAPTAPWPPAGSSRWGLISSPRVSVVLVQKSERVYVYTGAKLPPVAPRFAWIWQAFVSCIGVCSMPQRIAGDCRCHARGNRRYIYVSWCLDAFPSVRETACFCGCLYYHSQDTQRTRSEHSQSTQKKRHAKPTLKRASLGFIRGFVLLTITKNQQKP